MKRCGESSLAGVLLPVPESLCFSVYRRGGGGGRIVTVVEGVALGMTGGGRRPHIPFRRMRCVRHDGG